MNVHGLLLAVTALVLTALSSLAAQSVLAPDPFLEAIDRMKRSIIPVSCRTKTNDLDAIAGTGFFTSMTGEFITAAHVVEAQRARVGCNAAVYLPLYGWDEFVARGSRVDDAQWFDMSCVTVDAAKDVARCRTNINLNQVRNLGIQVVPVMVVEATVPDGTPVTFMGFPGQMQQPISVRGFVGGYRPNGSVPRFDLVIDKGAWPGVSGGPVFLADGGVVGMVVQAGDGAFTGMAIARPSPLLCVGLGPRPSKPRPACSGATSARLGHPLPVCCHSPDRIVGFPAPSSGLLASKPMKRLGNRTSRSLQRYRSYARMSPCHLPPESRPWPSKLS